MSHSAAVEDTLRLVCWMIEDRSDEEVKFVSERYETELEPYALVYCWTERLVVVLAHFEAPKEVWLPRRLPDIAVLLFLEYDLIDDTDLNGKLDGKVRVPS